MCSKRFYACLAAFVLIAILCVLQKVSVSRLALTFNLELTAATSLSVNLQPKIVLTNDDGWDVFSIRSQFAALEDAGFNVCNNLSNPSIFQCYVAYSCSRLCCPPRLLTSRAQAREVHLRESSAYSAVSFSAVHHSHHLLEMTRTIVSLVAR